MTLLTNNHRSIIKEIFCNSNHDFIIWNFSVRGFKIFLIHRHFDLLILIFIWLLFKRFTLSNKVNFTVIRLILLSCYSLCFLLCNRFGFDRLIGDHGLHLNTLNCSNQIIAFVLLIWNTCIFMHSKYLGHVRIRKGVNKLNHIIKTLVRFRHSVHWTIKETKLKWFFYLFPFYYRWTLLLRT